MNILLVNNFYYNRGGDCTYLFSLKSLLEDRGHKVSIFSMHHPLNYGTGYSKYFVSYINYEEEVRSKSISSGLRVAQRTIYSKEAKSKIAQLIEDEKPDIAHIQNIHHHITPSIFSVLKEKNVPIIWTLHDYTIICPNTSFLAQGKICERCRKRKYYWPSLVKCKKNSFAASTMAGIETAAHVAMNCYRSVDFFIAPSNFMQNKLVEYGIDREKIIHLNNFTCFVPADNKNENTGKYFVYLGRLSEEKGIRTLIDAAIQVLGEAQEDNGSYVNCKLKIIGDGPIKDSVISYVKSKKAQDKIELLGHKDHDDAMEILAGSCFLVLPSEWYENFPYSVLEAFTLGKPVIASRIGGIPELVKNWQTGLLFEPGNSEMLALKIGFFLRHPEKALGLGNAARQFMSGEIHAENHYRKLIDVYIRAIEMKRL